MTQLIDRLMRVRKGEVLTPLIDAHLRTHREEPFSPATLRVLFELASRKPRDRSGSFSVSQLATCMRYQVFRYWGTEGVEVPDGRLHSIFHDGHWRHLRWQGLLLEIGVVCQYVYVGDRLVILPPGSPEGQPALEVPVYDRDLRVRGSMDAVCEVDPFRWVVDVKGANPGAFAAARRNDLPLGYRWQLYLYGHLLGRRLGEGADLSRYKAMFLYEDKASQQVHEHHLTLEQRYMLGATARLRALNLHAAAQTMPAPLPNAPANPACRTCPYQLDCLEGLDLDEVPI